MRLLILSCTQSKVAGIDPIPALQRYDGRLWRLVRTYLAATPTADLIVYALSAHYGLIPATTPIAEYDAKMTPALSTDLQPQLLKDFAALMTQYCPTELGLAMSQLYLKALLGWQDYVPPDTVCTVTDGPMGVKRAQLRAWLEGRAYTPSAPPAVIEATPTATGIVTLAGRPIQATPAEVQALVQNHRQTTPGATRFRDWYVEIDGEALSPKWVVSLLAGLPPSAFDAGAARRVLSALGWRVYRVQVE